MDKPINTKTHAILDYLTGGLLLLAPDLLGFADVGGAAVAIPRIVGLGLIGLEAITRVEYSLLKIVPMPLHLTLDVMVGAFLLLSPFLFGFNDEKTNAWLPHIIVGTMIIIVAMLSKPAPEYDEVHS